MAYLINMLYLFLVVGLVQFAAMFWFLGVNYPRNRF